MMMMMMIIVIVDSVWFSFCVSTSQSLSHMWSCNRSDIEKHFQDTFMLLVALWVVRDEINDKICARVLYYRLETHSHSQTLAHGWVYYIIFRRHCAWGWNSRRSRAIEISVTRMKWNGKRRQRRWRTKCLPLRETSWVWAGTGMLPPATGCLENYSNRWNTYETRDTSA